MAPLLRIDEDHVLASTTITSQGAAIATLFKSLVNNSLDRDCCCTTTALT
jgi:hypothetical protein